MIVITIDGDETMVPGHCCLATMATNVTLPLDVLACATAHEEMPKLERYVEFRVLGKKSSNE